MVCGALPLLLRRHQREQVRRFLSPPLEYAIQPNWAPRRSFLEPSSELPFVLCSGVVSKELPIENKVFFFDVGENPRGRFLRVSESGAGWVLSFVASYYWSCDLDRPRGRSSLIIPSGGAGLTGWANFRDTLSRIYAAEAQLSGQPAVPIVPDSGVDVSDLRTTLMLYIWVHGMGWVSSFVFLGICWR